MRRTAQFAAILITIAMSLGANAPSTRTSTKPADKSDEVSLKIVAFCKSQIGKMVGDGECASLATNALRDAKARRRARDDPEHGDYVWGDLVLVATGGKPLKLECGKLADIRAGDIIQFRDTRFEGAIGRGRYHQTFPHHTAIVSGCAARGVVVKIFQQNVNGKREVSEAQLQMTDMKEGWMRFYRPIATSQPVEPAH